MVRKMPNVDSKIIIGYVHGYVGFVVVAGVRTKRLIPFY